MAENVYEGLFILDSNRYASDPNATSGFVEKTIQGFDGDILASRLWEERRLAYPIEGHRKGSYWLTYFKIDGRKIANITRELQIDDTVLRTMIVKVEPRLVDALVSHAAGIVPEEEA
ncbi:MAG: 30S ribosomal protein S6, partial [Planctomycetales bacterium]